jgi:3-carboxy-cis,cis-muconate cycloisomerase
MTAFAPIFAPADIRAAVDDRAWFAAMLEAELALAAAGAADGIVPADAAAAVAECCRVELYDLDSILEEARGAGTPVEPLVRALREEVGAPAADWVHRGATSQDILDSAAMLVASRASRLALDHATAAAAAAATLADEHRETVMASRTLLQQAVPTTFGLVAAGWLVALVDAKAWLERVRSDGLAAQLGGAAGTLGAFGVGGAALADDFARRLGLAQPALPWHTNRVRVANVGAALAALAGACGKIGRDITLLTQTEVAEVAEATGSGHGVSSTMPQKRNPVSSVVAVSCARGAAAASSVLTGSLVQEHQRAAGAWHAEWDALTSALLYAGGAAASVRSALEGLEVFPARMEENIDRAGGVVFAEAVSFAIGDRIGPAAAKALVRELAGQAAARGADLRDELRGDPRVIDAALDPAASLGAVGELIDRALAQHAASVAARA